MASAAVIAAHAAELIETRHWAAHNLRGAFSYAVHGGGYGRPSAGVFHDYEACMAFERHCCGERKHRNDGELISETATDRARRVGPTETVAALRRFVEEAR